MSALPPVSVFDGALDERIRDILAAYDVPGAAVAIVSDGLAFASGFGRRRLGRPEPVGPRTAFNVGSTSKAFSATAAAVLVARGVMTWDDPVRRWLPDFSTWNEADAAVMTLRDLSGNRAGLPRNGILEFGTELKIPAEEVVRRLRFARPAAGLRERFTYSNIAHTAVALAVEQASGLTYVDFLKREVFGPLGMADASGGAAARDDLEDASGWHCALDGKTIEIPPVFTDVHRGSAGLCLSAEDAARWLAFNLGDGSPILPAAGLAELFAPQIALRDDELAIWIAPPGATDAAYALGWGVATQNGTRVVRHSGSDFGINAHVALAPSEGRGVAVYVNKDCKASIEISYAVFDALMGWPMEDWRKVILDRRLPDTNAGFKHSALRPNGARPDRPPEAYSGWFRSRREGSLEVAAEADRLVLRFLDAPTFNGELAPLGHDRFLAVPDYTGLISDAVGGRFEAEFSFMEGRVSSLTIHGIGVFERGV